MTNEILTKTWSQIIFCNFINFSIVQINFINFFFGEKFFDSANPLLQIHFHAFRCKKKYIWNILGTKNLQFVGKIKMRIMRNFQELAFKVMIQVILRNIQKFIFPLYKFFNHFPSSHFWQKIQNVPISKSVL